MKIIFDISDAWKDWEVSIDNLPKSSKYEIIKTTDAKTIGDIYIPLMTDIMKNIPKSCHKLVLCPDETTVSIFNNKVKFQRYMEDTHPNLVPKRATKESKLCVIKKDYGTGGNGVFLTNNVKLINSILDVWVEEKANCVLQEYIWSDNYMVGQYMVINGEVIHKAHYKINLQKGKPTMTNGRLKQYEKTNYRNEAIEEVFKKIKYTGFACVDFTVTENGAKIFEINPRVGGTMMNDKEDFSIFIDKLWGATAALVE